MKMPGVGALCKRASWVCAVVNRAYGVCWGLLRGCKPRKPPSVGKDRLIFTFQARALSNYRGYFPVCDGASANYRRLVPRPGCAVVNRAYGFWWVGVLCKRASLDARL